MKKTIFLLLILMSFCLSVCSVYAQDDPEPAEQEVPERVVIDGSALMAGKPFRFTVTVDSDEMLTFADAQTQLTAVLCPADTESPACQTLMQSAEGEDDTTMRIVFSAEALPAAGDYLLDVSFFDGSGGFASQTASYLLTGVRPAPELPDGPENTGTPEGTPAGTEAAPETTETPEPDIDVPMTVKPVTLVPEFLDENGTVLNYSTPLYVKDPYFFRVRSDSAMNESVTVRVELPASLQAAPLDPECSCFQYMNADGTAMLIPGSLWSEESGNAFSCELRYTDRVWLPSDPLVFSMDASGIRAEETFEMTPIRWSNYPTNITQHPATHQVQVTDSRGNLLCSDMVACGMFSSDEVYILTYKFPADWGGSLKPGGSFTADLTWPAPWAASLADPANLETAAAYGTPCEAGADGVTHLDLTEISEGRYLGSCAFTPGAIQDAVTSAVNVHLNDNGWAVQDLSLGLSPVIIKEQPQTGDEPSPDVTEEALTGTETPAAFTEETLTGAETPAAVTEEVPAVTGTPEPVFDVPMTVKPVTLTPSVTDRDGNPLSYGSTLYVGEAYYLRLSADSTMNDSVLVKAALPASILNGPLDPASGCLEYLGPDGTTLLIPGSRWNAEEGNTFSCELRFTDSAWLASNPFGFSVEPSGMQAAETYEMAPLSWTYYPVNIAKYAASHQVQISDSRGNLICSDMVPCGYFNAEDVYVITYKFPADWAAALPSGRDLSASVTWPEDWALSIGLGTDYDLASIYGTPCAVDANGQSTLVLQETAPGRYSASCTFVPSGISNPRQVPAVVHMNDNAWQVSNLNVYLPGTIMKTQAVLSPSLLLRMTEDAADVEQIRGGTVGRLYRTSRNYPNNGEGAGAPAYYTLEARVEGISSARTPQPGDVVKVSWNVLDSLAAAGDLPVCLTPSGNGYILGDLQQTADGSWLASCSFRFPQTMPEKISAGRLDMQLLSGVYQTSAFANVNGDPFQREKLVLDLDIPDHMLLNQPTVIHARLSDSTGGFSDYTRAVLSDMGVSLRNDWVYNYLTDCQGEFVLAADGTASCTAYFDQPTAGESDMHFELTSPAADYLFDVVMQPAEYFHIESVSEISASLSVKLFHAGTEMNLPAAPDDVFIVGDDYQLQFYLTPDPEFRDVLNSVALDSEGMVMDWWDPLVIRWAILPSGETGLNFYRDGDHFIARYDFSFSQGDLALDGNLNHMMMVPSISGWNIRTENDMDLVQLPFRVEKKPLSLSISDFYLPFSSDPVTELKVGEEATFFVSFDGIIDSLDMNQMLIGFDANGIRTPLTCEPDYAGSMLRCSIIGQCTDYAIDTYNAVCSTNVSLYASYNGDSVNRAAEAEPKFFSVRRGEITFTPAAEGSLSAADLYHIQEASEDLLYLRDATVNVSGWNLDSFLPRKVTDTYGTEYRSYPVIFNYEISGSAAIDDSLLRLDVKYQSGPASLVQENTISLSPRIVTDDMVMFELDFGSFEYLDDGRTVQQALEEAVAIESLTVRYPGSALVGSASASYQSEDLTFVIKIADLVELASDSGMPGMISFGGAFGTLIPRDSFTVYCTQLAQQLECSSELPPLFYDENGEMIQTDFADAGCWGKIQLSSGTDQIFTSNAWNPVCYLVGWDPAQKIVVAGAIQ